MFFVRSSYYSASCEFLLQVLLVLLLNSFALHLGSYES